MQELGEQEHAATVRSAGLTVAQSGVRRRVFGSAIASCAAAATWSGTVAAHAPDGTRTQAPSLVAAFSLDPWVLLPLALLLLLHGTTLLRMRHSSAVGAATLTAAALGWLCLLLATVWPLDRLGEWSLAAHMAQHLLLMAFVPPLLLVALPPAMALHALPSRWQRPAGRAMRPLNDPSLLGSSAALTVATALQTAVMWGWHWPPLMQLALVDDLVHYAMHASFLAAGLLFWWSLLLSLRAPGSGFAPGAAAIVVAMMQMGLMGALLTFAPRVLYPFYVGRVEQLGISAFEDQQLAGLLMWVPASVPYLVGGLWLLHRWLAQMERRSAAAEQG
jgi:putative membrane protein